jgi:Mg2+ and Co2+ transporter CorA
LFVDTSKDTGQNGEEHLPEESYFTNTYVFPLRTLSSPANEEYQHLIDGTPTDDTTSPSDGLQVKVDSIKKSPGAREETPLEEFAFPPKLVFAKDSLSSQYFGTPTSIPRKDSDAIQFSFAEHGKRFTIIGLCGECRSFDTVDLLWSYIKDVYTSRYDNLLRRSSDPDFLMNHLHEFHKLVPYVEPLWIDIQQPSVEDMLIVQDHFGIHPTTIEDCLTDRGSEGEKWEHFEEYLAIVLAAMSVSSTNQLSSIKITETALSTKGLTSLNIILFDVSIRLTYTKDSRILSLLFILNP